MTMSSDSEEYCRNSSARRRCLKKGVKKNYELGMERHFHTLKIVRGNLRDSTECDIVIFQQFHTLLFQSLNKSEKITVLSTSTTSIIHI